ncbi:hypothetical protein C0992_008712 [Termitomyces sp. T32_za158]|nr:hypothetical protein C0992_008712 [Termitomyces sp. T32_za158]
MEAVNNYKVLFGKKDKTENTSGETKVTVYKHIGQKILPELFDLDAGTVADRIKSKIESLTKMYRKQHSKIYQTGGGIQSERDENQPESQSNSQETILDYYIPSTGPDEMTPIKIKNLWKQIEAEFLFFPRLYNIFSTRPNVVPIAVTTALGPNGCSTVWYQDPGCDDSTSAAPALPEVPRHQGSTPSPVLTPQRSFGSDILSSINLPIDLSPESSPTKPTHNAKPLSVSWEALHCAQANIPKAAPKRSLGDTLLEMQREQFAMLQQKNMDKLVIKKRGQLIEEYRLGIWNREEYLKQVSALEFGSEPISKRTKRAHSPDWDEDQLAHDLQ